MNVQLNVKKATSRVKSFLEEHGGTAQHSEVLELVAGMCGFDSYRALKAVSSKKAVYSGVRAISSTDKQGPRPLEDESRVVFKATAVDWQLADNPDIGFDEVPEDCRRKYDVVLEQYGGQFRLLMKPEGVGLDNFDGESVLDILVEINNGVPCVHMTNDPVDAMLLTVFATEHGLLVRPDDGEWLRASDYRVPRVLQELANSECGGPEFVRNSYVALCDTAEKYRDEPGQEQVQEQEQRVAEVTQPLAAVATGQGSSLRELPYARSVVEMPISRRHVGSYVMVVFDRPADVSGNRLGVNVTLFDVDGVPGDDDMVEVMSSYAADSPLDQLHSMAVQLAALVTFFLRTGFSMERLEPMILSVVQAEKPHQFVKDLADLAYREDYASAAFDAVASKIEK